MDIIQYAFSTGNIPVECVWNTVVLIPNGNGKLCRIGIMEVILMAVSGVVNFWIGLAVNLHNALQRFREGRGTGTAPHEFKIIQKLTGMEEEVL